MTAPLLALAARLEADADSALDEVAGGSPERWVVRMLVIAMRQAAATARADQLLLSSFPHSRRPGRHPW